MGGGIAWVSFPSFFRPCLPEPDAPSSSLIKKRMNFANVGIPVTIVEVNGDALKRGLGVIQKNYENTAKKGRITEADVKTRMSLLKGSMDYSALSDCDLIIEAIFENMAVKKEVFAKLASVSKPTAILASNTSALDIDEIASGGTLCIYLTCIRAKRVKICARPRKRRPPRSPLPSSASSRACDRPSHLRASCT